MSNDEQNSLWHEIDSLDVSEPIGLNSAKRNEVVETLKKLASTALQVEINLRQQNAELNRDLKLKTTECGELRNTLKERVAELREQLTMSVEASTECTDWHVIWSEGGQVFIRHMEYGTEGGEYVPKIVRDFYEALGELPKACINGDVMRPEQEVSCIPCLEGEWKVSVEGRMSQLKRDMAALDYRILVDEPNEVDQELLYVESTLESVLGPTEDRPDDLRERLVKCLDIIKGD